MKTLGQKKSGTFPNLSENQAMRRLFMKKPDDHITTWHGVKLHDVT